MKRLSVFFITAVFAAPAFADRPVTPEETASIESALAAEGCSGGTYEVEDENNVVVGFEVNNAVCANNVVTDFDLNMEFQIVSRDIED